MNTDYLQKMMPMSPASGPPLPSGLQVLWPWRGASVTITVPTPLIPVPRITVTTYSPALIPTPPNVARWVLGDIISMNGKLYTVRGVDPYDKRYLLGDGAYPQDTVENYWRYTSQVDPVSSYVDHIEIIIYE